MRRFLNILIIVCAAILIFAAVLYLPSDTRVQSSAQHVSPTESASQAVPDPLIGLPVTLLIPALSIDTNIQSVGKTASGAMANPQGAHKFREVGWYKFGPRPGQAGSAVIDGHLDNALSLKGVFYHLDQLQVGDTVIVRTASSTQAVFRVAGSKVYDYKQSNAEEVFLSADGKAHLNLITCDGTWVQSEKSYTQRLVVFTDLVSISTASSTALAP
jgi:sortase A